MLADRADMGRGPMLKFAARPAHIALPDTCSKTFFFRKKRTKKTFQSLGRRACCPQEPESRIQEPVQENGCPPPRAPPLLSCSGSMSCSMKHGKGMSHSMTLSAAILRDLVEPFKKAPGPGKHETGG
jgi:hypothetical protein